MIGRRKIGLFILTALLTAAGLWWAAYVPERPLRAFRAIPAGADFVSLHDRFADRSDELLATPLARLFAGGFGLTAEQWDAVRSDGQTRVWIRRLADRRVVAAALPLPGGRHAWFAASDIGARAIRLRWMLKLGALPAFQKFGTHGGRTLWMLAPELTGTADRLALTFEEGLLITTWSADPRDLLLALEAYDGTIESMGRTGLGERLAASSAAPDRMWWRGDRAWPLGSAWIRIERADAGGIEGRAEFPDARGRLARPGRGANAGDAAALFGRTPYATIAFDPEWLVTQLHGLPAPGPAVLLLDYVRRETTGPAAVGLFGGDFSGRLFGMKTPGMVAAATLRRPDAAAAMLMERVDRLNVLYRAAASLGPVPDTGGPLLAITVSSVPFYAALPTSEQAAVAFRSNRIYAASNLETLRAVVSAAPAAAAAPASAVSGAALLRLNLKEGAPSIRNGLAVVALALMMQDREGTRAARAAINQIRDTLRWLEPLERIEADLLLAEDDTPVIRFAAGAPAPAGGAEP